MFERISEVKHEFSKWSEKIYLCLFVLLPPTFYAIVAGAFVSIAVNLMTGLILAQETNDRLFVQLAIVLFSTCSGTFACISIILEHLRSEASSREQFVSNVEYYKKVLLPLIIWGIGSLIAGAVMLYLG